MADQEASRTVTAALVVIGEEILSGRTSDENIAYIAAYLTRIGIASARGPGGGGRRGRNRRRGE